jgi:hypothetical protein
MPTNVGGVDFPTMDEFNALVARVVALEGRNHPELESGNSVLTLVDPQNELGQKHAVVILHWKPSRVVVDPPSMPLGSWSPDVTIRDDGFEIVVSGLNVGTVHWTAYR